MIIGYIDREIPLQNITLGESSYIENSSQKISPENPKTLLYTEEQAYLQTCKLQNCPQEVWNHIIHSSQASPPFGWTIITSRRRGSRWGKFHISHPTETWKESRVELMVAWCTLVWLENFFWWNLFGRIPVLCTLGIHRKVDVENVLSTEGFRHALDNNGLSNLCRLGRSFQDHFIMDLTSRRSVSSYKHFLYLYRKPWGTTNQFDQHKLVYSNLKILKPKIFWSGSVSVGLAESISWFPDLLGWLSRFSPTSQTKNSPRL